MGLFKDFKVGREQGDSVERSHVGRETPPVDARTGTVVPQRARSNSRSM